MARHTNLNSLFKDIADAIRAKTGNTANIVADNFPEEIANMQTGLQVKSITTKGAMNSATYHQAYWAAIDANGNLLLVVQGGTSTSYESVYFETTSVPTGVTLVGQSYYSYSSMSAGKMYAAVYSGLTKSVNIELNFDDANSSSDYVFCYVTITEA